MDNLQKARFNMIQQQIRPWQVHDEAVLGLMNQIPREHFVPEGYEGVAYSDTAIPLNSQHTMMQPKMVARALQALKIQPAETVLEVGTGTGYVTALLSKLAAHVYSVEIEPVLYERAKKNLSSGFKNVTLELGDGSLGWETHAPYSVILVAGSYPLSLPKTIESQLKQGGRCFAILGTAPLMHACLFTMTKGQLKKEILFEALVPNLENAPRNPDFEF